MQAPLFDAVWSPTDEMLNGKTGLAPDEGRDGEQRQEGGACQRPALLTQQSLLEKAFLLYLPYSLMDPIVTLIKI